MSDFFDQPPAPKFDPLLGAPAERPESPPMKPQVSFENSKLEMESLDPEIEKEIKMQEYMDLVRRASKTKFATGDIEKDIYLYKAFRRFIGDMGVD